MAFLNELSAGPEYERYPAAQASRSSFRQGAPSQRAQQRTPRLRGAKPDRLKAGGLEPIVLDYLAQNMDSGPHGPAAVAKAINRSSGAVANCLKRLAASNQAGQVSDKPLRYDKLAA
jgi:hypothetical protein